MTQTSTAIATLIPAYYDRLLLDNLYPDLYLYQFGVKKNIPRNFGKTVTFTRYFKMNKNSSIGTGFSLSAMALTEGTPIGLSALSAATVTATLSGFGAAIGVSDLIVMTAISDVVRGAVYELSKGAALKIERKTRQTISATGALLPARNTAGTGSLNIATTSTLQGRDLYRAVAKLRQSDARTWPDGNFAAVMHPRVALDIKSESATTSPGAWIEINKYATDQTVGLTYRGEVGRIGGARVVESSEAKQLFGSPISTGASGFMTMVIGPGAYGEVELDNMAASVYVHQVGSAGSADPINQRGSVGVKVYFAPVALEAARMVRLTSGGHSL
jgi:N4-gp56 family major capsid protein